MGNPNAPAISYAPKQQQNFKPPLVENDNAFLGDIFSSDVNDKDKPISCGLYRLEKGQLKSTDP